MKIMELFPLRVCLFTIKCSFKVTFNGTALKCKPYMKLDGDPGTC